MLGRLDNILDRFYTHISKQDFWVAYIVIVINLLLKFYNVSFGSIDLDESWHTFYAQMPFKELIKTAQTDPNPPLYNILIGCWIKIFGLSELAIRSFSVILSSITAGLVFLFARKYLNIQTAFWGALLFTFSNVQFFYAHDARVYALVGLLTVVSFYYFQGILLEPSIKQLLLFSFVNTLLIYTHTAAVYVFFAQFVASLTYFHKSKRGILFSVIGQFLAVLLFVPWVKSSSYYNKPKPTSWMPPPSLSEVKQLFFDYFNGQTSLSLVILVLLVFLALIVFRKKAFKPLIVDFSKLWMLLGWALLPIAINIVVSYLVVPIFLKRYMLYATMGLYLSSVFLIFLLPIRNFLKTLVAAILLLLFAVNIDMKTFIGESWREGVEYVKKNKKENDLVIVSPFYEYTAFAYYYNKDFYADTHHTLDRMANDNIYMGDDSTIFQRHNIKDYKKVIVLTAQEDMVDPTSILGNLKKNSSLIDEIHFWGVNGYVFSSDLASRLLEEHRLNFDSLGISSEHHLVELTNAHSGKIVSEIYKDNPYSPGFERFVKELRGRPYYLEVEGWCLLPDIESDAALVCSFDLNGKSIQYNSISTDAKTQRGKWQKLTLHVKFPPVIQPAMIMKAYVMSNAFQKSYVDDITIKVFSE